MELCGYLILRTVETFAGCTVVIRAELDERPELCTQYRR